MRTKENILFDLDGTLTDPGVGITKSVRYALRAYGIEVDSLEKLRPFVGPPLANSFMEFYGFSKEEASRAVDKYREYFSKTGLFENEIYPGIRELLKELSACGKKLFLATSKPTVFAEQILEHFALGEFFAFVGGSLLSGERVEKKAVMEYVLKENGLLPEDAVMVGDRRFDIESAKALGISSVGVLYGYGSREELTLAGADVLAECVEELRDILV